MKKIFIGIIAITLITISTFILSSLTMGSSISGGRVHLHKPISLPMDTDLLKENTLLFLGYAACPDICTPRMYEIQKIYDEYTKVNNKNDLSVLFISLKSSESQELVDTFAKTFNPEFIGISPQKKSLSRLSRTLNAYYSKSLTDDETIDHTEFLYLIKKEKDGTVYLKNMYIQTPYNKNMVVSDLVKDNQ